MLDIVAVVISVGKARIYAFYADSDIHLIKHFIDIHLYIRKEIADSPAAHYYHINVYKGICNV